MRHFYFRLIIGIVWLVAALISLVSLNLPFLFLYVLMGIAFLYSAYTIWKKEKGERR